MAAYRFLRFRAIALTLCASWGSSRSCLPQVEIHFNIQRHVDRHAIFRARFKPPLFEGLDGVLIKTESKAANNSLNVDCAVSAHDGLKNDSALITGFARFFRILRLNA